MIYRDKEFRV